mmetsp:Transcript_30942/g.92016  ORF Transcript_30942/g.92016 Transcript_30942/m.92016 type:complete len:497 (-) Transcript_30942:55-1545(-)
MAVQPLQHAVLDAQARRALGVDGGEPREAPVAGGGQAVRVEVGRPRARQSHALDCHVCDRLVLPALEPDELREVWHLDLGRRRARAVEAEVQRRRALVKIELVRGVQLLQHVLHEPLGPGVVALSALEAPLPKLDGPVGQDALGAGHDAEPVAWTPICQHHALRGRIGTVRQVPADVADACRGARDVRHPRRAAVGLAPVALRRRELGASPADAEAVSTGEVPRPEWVMRDLRFCRRVDGRVTPVQDDLDSLTPDPVWELGRQPVRLVQDVARRELVPLRVGVRVARPRRAEAVDAQGVDLEHICGHRGRPYAGLGRRRPLEVEQAATREDRLTLCRADGNMALLRAEHKRLIQAVRPRLQRYVQRPLAAPATADMLQQLSHVCCFHQLLARRAPRFRHLGRPLDVLEAAARRVRVAFVVVAPHGELQRVEKHLLPALGQRRLERLGMQEGRRTPGALEVWRHALDLHVVPARELGHELRRRVDQPTGGRAEHNSD